MGGVGGLTGCQAESFVWVRPSVKRKNIPDTDPAPLANWGNRAGIKGPEASCGPGGGVVGEGGGVVGAIGTARTYACECHPSATPV